MHWKIYLFLLVPFILIGVPVILLLPAPYNQYGYILSVVFWIIYYSWVIVDIRKKKRVAQRTSL